jgi:hypothetical protein
LGDPRETIAALNAGKGVEHELIEFGDEENLVRNGLERLLLLAGAGQEAPRKNQLAADNRSSPR